MDVPAKATASPDIEELADYLISKFCEVEDLDYVQQNSRNIDKLSSGKWQRRYCTRVFSQKVLQPWSTIHHGPLWGFRFYEQNVYRVEACPAIWFAPENEVHLTEIGEIHAYDQSGVSVDFTDSGSRIVCRFVAD